MTERSAALDVIRTLRNRGYQAYLVGGCVRDLLLGREPADYDVSTDATPDEVMRIFPRTLTVGAQFGVVLVPLKSLGIEACESEADAASHPHCIEVATFRSDGAYSDGRHPDSVRYTDDPREDVQRRDFTINGLMLDPAEGGENGRGWASQVLDFVGGRADLQNKVIRTIGDPERRFTEDKLRMLRAVRFAARFEYAIDAATMQSIQRLAPRIAQVSRERVRDELTKMLTEGRAARAFELLDDSRLLPQVLPEVAKMKGVEQPPQFHPEGDVWVHTLLLLKNLPTGASRTLAWGALLHDVGKPPTFRIAPDRIRFDGHVEIGVKMAEQICQRLRMSNDDTEQIMALVANHMKFPEVRRMRESTFKRFIRQPRFDEHLELHRLDCLGSHGKLDLYDFTKEKAESLPPDEVRPEPLISGYDLIKAGYQPGPHFKEILAAIEDAQLEGTLSTRAEALEWVKRNHPQ
jgi:poly(A) polymerase